MLSAPASSSIYFEALDAHLPGQFVVGAGRRPIPQHELARIDLRKQLGAHLQAQQSQNQDASSQVGRNHNPAQAHEPAYGSAINAEQAVEETALALRVPV